jgi:hypothetical protein
MEELAEFIKRFQARLTAWYLTHERDYSYCETCGPYDDRNPDLETIHRLIKETLEEMKGGK